MTKYTITYDQHAIHSGPRETTADRCALDPSERWFEFRDDKGVVLRVSALAVIAIEAVR